MHSRYVPVKNLLTNESQRFPGGWMLDARVRFATLTSAYDAFIQYLREHETRLRFASKPKRVSNDIGAGGR